MSGCLTVVALGIVVIRLNNTLRDDYSNWIADQVIKVAVSMWPILFGIVVGASLRTMALFLAERGASLMTLEQLIASRTVGSAALGPFQYAKFDLVAIGLLFLWLLSPLASQALLRIQFENTLNATSLTPLVYVATNGSAPYWSKSTDGNDKAGDNPFLSQLKGLYTASLIAPDNVQISHVDTWGNVRIPMIEPLEAHPVDADGWYACQHDNMAWASMLGIPIVGILSTGENNASVSITNFTVEASYFNLQCSTPKSKPRADIYPLLGIDTPPVNSNFAERGHSYTNLNITKDATGNVIPDIPGILQFVSQMPNKTEDNFAYIECTYGQSHVESDIGCVGNHCVVNRVRRSKLDFTANTTSPLSGNSGITFIKSLSEGSGAAEDDDASITEKYILNPMTAFGNKDGKNGFVDLTTVSQANVTFRIGILLNTYWQSGFAPILQTSALNQTLEEAARVPAVQRSTMGQNVVITEVFSASFPWLAVLFACCAILIAAAILNCVIDSRLLAPDILGYVSSITLSNPYIPLPKGGSTLDGVDRTKAIGHVKVRLQDVANDEEVGRIALSSIEGAPLKKGRRYW